MKFKKVLIEFLQNYSLFCLFWNFMGMGAVCFISGFGFGAVFAILGLVEWWLKIPKWVTAMCGFIFAFGIFYAVALITSVVCKSKKTKTQRELNRVADVAKECGL